MLVTHHGLHVLVRCAPRVSSSDVSLRFGGEFGRKLRGETRDDVTRRAMDDGAGANYITVTTQLLIAGEHGHARAARRYWRPSIAF